MIPLRVSMKNFLCHEDQTFDFDGPALWLLHGPNGVGKSAVFDAMLYALYGTHHRRETDGGKAPGLIRHGANSLRVEFTFEVRDRRFTVWRMRDAKRSQQGADEIIDGTPVPVGVGNNQRDIDQWVNATLGLNEEAFVSAVLLRQGAAERLIDADDDARVTLFRGIIDLEPYVRLQKDAESERAAKGGVLRNLQAQKKLADEEMITPQAVEDAATSLAVAVKTLETNQTTVQQVRDRLEAARKWEKWKGEWDALQTEIAEARQRAEIATTLRSQWQRLQELRTLVPKLRDYAAAEREWKTCAEHETHQQQLVSAAQATFEEWESKATAAAAMIREQTERATQLKQTWDAALAEHKTLSQEIARADAAVAMIADRDAAEKEWNALKPDLDARRTAAEAELAEAQVAKDALPHWKTLATQRAVWHDARTATAAIDLAALTTAVNTAKDVLGRAGKDETAALAAYAKARETYAVKQAQRNELKAKAERFRESSTQPECPACGQPINPKRVADELKALDQKMAAAEAELNTLKDDGKKRKQHADAMTAANTTAEASHRAAELALADAITRQRQITERMTAAVAAYDEARGAVNVVAIDATGFPTAGAMDATRRLAETWSEKQAAHAERLAACQKRDALKDRLATLKAATIALGVPADVSAARQRVLALDGDIARLKDEHAAAMNSAAAAMKDESTAAAAAKTHRTAWDAAKVILAETTTARAVAAHKRDTAGTGLDITLDAATLDEEQQSLETARVEHQAKALEDDQRQHDDRLARMQVLDEEQAATPPEAQRPVSEVDAQLKAAQKAATAAEAAKTDAALNAERVKREFERQGKLREELTRAEQEYAIHETLAEMLGEDKLQQWLTASASRTIAAAADEALARISNDELRLAPSGDTLDLHVRRHGSEPIPVGRLSGGQRCRVAVALALAVCQYASDTRPLESLIIDEAFANLDAEGRRAMIELLRSGTLSGGRLKRIIVVSHSDDVMAAFPNRFQLEPANGRTKVTRVTV